MMINRCLDAISVDDYLNSRTDAVRTETIPFLGGNDYVGQVFTPAFVANLMACFFKKFDDGDVVLDPGVGTASLSSAICRRVLREGNVKSLELYGFDIDDSLIPASMEVLNLYKDKFNDLNGNMNYSVANQDFIKLSCNKIATSFGVDDVEKYDKIIMNPPYGKISSSSKERKRLREIGIETVNYYSAFLSLAIRQLKVGGELVSITPRSFCNGPYYKQLRDDITKYLSIENICLFNSRKTAFKEQNVLQETVIFHFKKKEQSEKVSIITVDGLSHDEVQEHLVLSSNVIGPKPNSFIHITTSQDEENLACLMNQLPCTLDDLGVQVSTGRVVDFRSKQYLLDEIDSESVPLVYPKHFSMGRCAWPSAKAKSNAILIDANTQKMMDVAGTYVVVKRFSSKEEKKRIVATAINLNSYDERFVAFDNKTNYFHCDRKPLQQDFADGLSAFLNSTVVDKYFRIFNGHTQVNATDLRFMCYPNSLSLEEIGRSIADFSDQNEIDQVVNNVIFNTSQCKNVL